jgi:exopolysaccharide production negative regulator
MRTCNVALSLGLIALASGLSPVAGFDGTRTPEMAPVAAPLPQGAQQPAVSRVAPLGTVPLAPQSAAPQAPSQTPFDAFRSGTQALREGRTNQGVMALEYAAGQGVPAAMWKLGRIYADGEGVDRNELRAFEYFRDLTRKHAYDPPGTAQARFVANAFVSLGHFYLEGIPNSEIKADPAVAHGMFRHAASYFGDSEAQYQVGRMYLQGRGTQKDALQAARWLKFAAERGHRNAQALLGTVLFKGTDVSRQAAMGLFWLTVARDAVAKEGAGPDDKWIAETYTSAFSQATEDERAVAFNYLNNWMRARKR